MSIDLTIILKKAIISAEKKIMKEKTMSGIYGLAFVGALVYYIQHATSFLDGCLGILKALVWPAMIMYKALELLHM